MSERDERFAEMMARFLGPDAMAAIADRDVTGVYVNPDGRLRLVTHSEGRLATEVVLTPTVREEFLNTAATYLGTTVTPDQPILGADLPQTHFRGARLRAFLPPIVTAPVFVIRKRALEIYPLSSYVERGSLSVAAAEVLREAMRERWNVLVAGGTGTGKTTFLNALLREIAEVCPADRLLVLEDRRELQPTSSDVLSLQRRESGTLAELVKSGLDADPTRYIVGQIVDAAALDWLDAASTGHPGSLATIHADDVMGALWRLERLARRGSDVDHRALVAEVVDLVVMIRGSGMSRRVSDLVRVRGLNESGHYHLTPLEEA